MRAFTARIAEYDIIQYHLERYMGCDGCNQVKFLRESKNGGLFCRDCFCQRCRRGAKVDQYVNCRMCEKCYGASVLFKERNATKLFKYSLQQKRPDDTFADVLDIRRYYFENEEVESQWYREMQHEYAVIPITEKDSEFVEKVKTACNPPNPTLNFSIIANSLIIEPNFISGWGVAGRIEDIYKVCRMLVLDCGYYWKFTLPIIEPYVDEFLNLRAIAGIH